ncbi:MAG: type II toxin-antitoxin system ParD family antitoxin [Sphingomonas sp.]|nr:type II toxin-antitoxin system ParD family antitoxin [Sphingomonas sp.]
MASKNTSVTLSDHFIVFAERQVASGRYGSTSDVVRAGLRLLEAEEAQFERLRAAIKEGIDSGPPVPFDLDDFLGEMHAKAAAG